jgi:hypothetical protein
LNLILLHGTFGKIVSIGYSSGFSHFYLLRYGFS